MQPSEWPVDEFIRSLTSASEHTRRAYEHDAHEFVEWCRRGACPTAATLDHRVLRRYLAYLTTRGFARTTISRKAASVRAFSRYLRRTGLVEHDAGRHLRAPAGTRRLPRVPRAADTAVLLADAEARVEHAGHHTGRDGDGATDVAVARRDLALLELLYGTGTRISECCGLDLDDIDLRRAHITVLGKGSKVRRLPLGDAARAAISEYLADRPPAARHRHQPGRSRVPQPARKTSHSA